MPALNNNLVVSKDGHQALVELMQSKQPGDKLRLTLEGIDFEAKVVENLSSYVSFDICQHKGDKGEKYAVAPRDEKDESKEEAEEQLAATIIGVMKSAS